MQSDLSQSVRPLLTPDQIATRVAEIGAEITNLGTHNPLTVLGVMTGGLMFLADLVRQIRRPLQLGVLHARSYAGNRSGPLELHLDTLPDLTGRHVIIVDDIFDTGQTITRVVNAVRSRRPAAVQTAVMLDKRVVRTTEFSPDWVGFEIADEFVVGYGLDYDGEYRHRPDIGVLEFV